MDAVTKYFRNAVVAQNNPTIDYRFNPFEIISMEEIENGNVSQRVAKVLFKKKDEEEEEKISAQKSKRQSIPIIIALKTIRLDITNAVISAFDPEEMTSILFLPALLSRQGILSMTGGDDGRLPWIPREYLTPMIEPELSIGSEEDYDRYLESTIAEKNQIDSWKKYLDYTRQMYEVVTKSKFDEDEISIHGNRIGTDGRYYIFKDETVLATVHIQKLYDHLLANTDTEKPLYSKLTDGITEASVPMIANDDTDMMKRHGGQMNGEYPLSPSQREALHHFNVLGNGEILAVNGPPGTGKTTLLQSIVADMYVSRALKAADPPIIVATSTINQAVTNIIDSFSKINPVCCTNLERRWIDGAHSFAVYFPSSSKSKRDDAKKNNYQYTDVRGNYFIEDMEAEDIRKKSMVCMLEGCQQYFEEPVVGIAACRDKILSELKTVDKLRDQSIEVAAEIKNVIGEDSYTGYLSKLDTEEKSLCENIDVLKEKIHNIDGENLRLHCRITEWTGAYQKLPWFWRCLKFLPAFKKKLYHWSFTFTMEEELEYFDRGTAFGEITKGYEEKLVDNHHKIKEFNTRIEETENSIEQLQQRKADLILLFEKLTELFAELKSHKATPFENVIESALDDFDLSKLSNALDKIRYIEFWLAVHYYESIWLSEEDTLTENQKKRNFVDVLENRYRRLAMIAPCMVMTFFMLPKQFLAYDGNTKNEFYMYGYIDLLIVDEAGQTSPEIAAASFSLAKKAIVVGDENQIPPVWGTTRALDIAMAIRNGVILNKTAFRIQEGNGLNCSTSSLMKVASLSCKFDQAIQYGKGLFLCEHRRCYDDIIEYCNTLVYHGRLQPKRGPAENDSQNALSGFLPAMGHREVFADASVKCGSSRVNHDEAEAIVSWIGDNYGEIVQRYRNRIHGNGKLNETNLLGVITPFKSQAAEIRKRLKRTLPEIAANITVGTIHTFQGAERNIIIFSSVYGADDGCFFIDHNKSLMNVAVSRAKDSFLVFGCMQCLSDSLSAPSGLLKAKTARNIDF
ncbi:MAG: hypothetical protein LBN34_05385 [Clostridiales Family XIII bacterium]|jgi:hypothetical protein|nr:hypothetical protein [Clostridiales Family XIII bacterium]